MNRDLIREMPCRIRVCTVIVPVRAARVRLRMAIGSPASGIFFHHRVLFSFARCA